MTPFHGIEAVMQTVFEVNAKRKFQAEMPHTSLESHLVQLLEDEERELRRLEQEAAKANDDGSVGSADPTSPSHAAAEARIKNIAQLKGGLEALDFDDDDDDQTVFTLTAGFLPANRIFDALKNAKHLRLSRVQVSRCVRTKRSARAKKPPASPCALANQPSLFCSSSPSCPWRTSTSPASRRSRTRSLRPPRPR